MTAPKPRAPRRVRYLKVLFEQGRRGSKRGPTGKRPGTGVWFTCYPEKFVDALLRAVIAGGPKVHGLSGGALLLAALVYRDVPALSAFCTLAHVDKADVVAALRGLADAAEAECVCKCGRPMSDHDTGGGCDLPDCGEGEQVME